MRRGLAPALRAAGIDCLTAQEAGNRRWSDPEQLEFAASVSRTIYTQNVRDFRVLHFAWISAGRPHAGIIVLGDQRTPIGVQVRALQRLDRVERDVGLANRFFFLENYRT